MSLKVDTVYKFSFLPSSVTDPIGWASLDGYYRLKGIVSYASISSEGVNLIEQLYEPAGKSETEFTTDLNSVPSLILDRTYYKLENVKTQKVLVIPSIFVAGLPMGDVNEYSRLMMNIDLGVFANPTQLAMIKNAVFNTLNMTQGLISDPADISLAIYDKEWLTKDEYDSIEEDRASIASTFPNYYKLAEDREAALLEAATRIAALEDLVTQLNSQLNP